MKQSNCPQCGVSFPFRSNKRFCSPTCRKLHSQRELRAKSPAIADNSRDIQREQMECFDLAMRMAEHLYTLPPAERFGYIKDIVDLGRSGECPRVRKILTFPNLLYPDPCRKHLFWRRCPSTHLTISQAADRYCRHFWKASVVDVVRGIAPEPPTGEIPDEPQLAA